MSPSRQESVRTAAILLAVYLALFAVRLGPGRVLVPFDTLNSVSPWSAWFKDEAQNRAVGDASTHHFEWAADFHQRVRSGDLPDWQPNILAGIPYTPNGSVSVHYPPSWLFVIFPPEAGFTLFIILHFWIAAFGMWLLVRRLGFSNEAALFSGFAYSMSGLVRDWAFGPLNLPPLVLAPLLLFFVETLIQKPTRASVALTAAVVGLILLGGNPQFSYHVFFASGIFGVIRIATKLRKPKVALVSGAALVIAVGLGLGLSAAEVIPSLDLAESIARVEEPSEGLRQSTASPAQIVRMAMPNFYSNPMRDESWAGNAELWMDSPYIGLLAAAMAVAAAIRVRDGRVMALGAIVALGAAAVFLPEVQVWAHQNVAYWGRFRGPVRWLSIFNLGTAALAGAGFHFIAERFSTLSARLLSAGALVGIVLLPFATIAFARPAIPGGYLGPELVSLAVVTVFAAGGLVAIWTGRPGLALAALVAEAFVYFLPFFPALATSRLHEYENVPEVRAARRLDFTRIARLGPSPGTTPALTHNFLMLLGKEDSMGLTVFMPARYADFINLIEDHGGFARQTNEIAQFQNPESLNSPLARLAGMNLVVVDPSVEPPQGWRIAFDGVLDLYRSPSEHPRAWIVPEVRLVPENELHAALKDPGFDPLVTAFVSNHGGYESVAGDISGGKGEVISHRRDADSDELIVEIDAPAMLVLDREFHSGWNVYVDGALAREVPVDVAFLGVVLRPGDHRVRFVFEWGAVRRGRIVSLASLVLILALAIPLPRRSNRPLTSLDVKGNQ